MTDPSDPTWKTCRFCGGTVAPGTETCPRCGTGSAVRPEEIRRLPARQRRHLRLTQGVRSLIVVGVAIGIAYAILSAVLAGPPTFPDPLTTQGTYTIAPGSYTYLSGWITGEDYIDGNYTILSPVGTALTFQVYNSTEFVAFAHGQPASPQWNNTGASSAPIVFAAPYTDTFYLVFENPYLPSSGIVQTIYIVTNYQSNVVLG